MSRIDYVNLELRIVAPDGSEGTKEIRRVKEGIQYLFWLMNINLSRPQRVTVFSNNFLNALEKLQAKLATPKIEVQPRVVEVEIED
jgi:hypothetical protein